MLQRGQFWCLRALTPPYIDGFSNYSLQMFFLAKRVMCKTHVHILKVIVTIWGQRQLKYCPEHIFYRVSKKKKEPCIKYAKYQISVNIST